MKNMQFFHRYSFSLDRFFGFSSSLRLSASVGLNQNDWIGAELRPEDDCSTLTVLFTVNPNFRVSLTHSGNLSSSPSLVNHDIITSQG